MKEPACPHVPWLRHSSDFACKEITKRAQDESYLEQLWGSLMLSMAKLLHLVDRLRRFSLAEQLLLWKVIVTFAALFLGIKVLPFRSVQQVVSWLAALPSWRLVRPVRDERAYIVWATSRLGAHFLTNKSCLVEALTVQLLFWRRGYPADLRIGVSKTDESVIAHAWVESEGQVVIGGPESVHEYAPFPALPPLGSPNTTRGSYGFHNT